MSKTNGSVIVRTSVLMTMLVLFSIVFSVSVYAALTTITLSTPTLRTAFINGTEYILPGDPFVLNITTNEAAENCSYSLEGSALVLMTNNTGTGLNTTFINTTQIAVFTPKGDNSPWRNLTIMCMDSGTTTVWYNTSATAGLGWFRINEKSSGKINITVQNMTNASSINYPPSTNITTNTTMANCSSYLNNVKGEAPIAMTSFSNQSGARNSSAISLYDSAYSTFNNITWMCQDAWGNKTWYNTSVSARFLLFKLDTVSPVISFTTPLNFTMKSANGYNFTFNFTDNNYAQCSIRYFKDGNTTSYTEIMATQSSAITTGNRSQSNCSATFSPAIISGFVNGKFTIQAFGNDSAVFGHSGVSATNFTGIAQKLIGGKWNLITFYGANATNDNETVGQFISNHLSNATQTAIYHNENGTYTTYSISTPTVNNGSILYPGLAFYVYVAHDSWLIESDLLSLFAPTGDIRENITLTTNTSARTSPWNQIGLLYNATMNDTTYALSTNLTYVDVQQLLNITSASYYNSTSGLYITCKRGWNSTPCSGTTLTAKEIVLPPGSAVWVQVDANVTLNRTRIGTS